MQATPSTEAQADLKKGFTAAAQGFLGTADTLQRLRQLPTLAWFHAVLLERRKFKSLGFNIPYEFSQADLSACVTYMQNHLNMMETKKRPVDWITVNYMVCDVQYGGKITDDFDRRLFNTYGKSWLTEKCLAEYEAEWSLENQTRTFCLIVEDMENDYLPYIDFVLPNAVTILNQFRKSGQPVVWTNWARSRNDGAWGGLERVVKGVQHAGVG